MTTPQGEATGWRKVLIAALEETAPTQVEGMPYVAPETSGPVQACICTKASCLTSWAKDQNKAKSAST